MPKNEIRYEWLIDVMEPDDSGDVFEVHHFDTLAEARAYVANNPDEICEVGLVRDVGNDAEGVIDRQWAYFDEDGKLPERMDWGGGETGGVKIPKHFLREAGQ